MPQSAPCRQQRGGAKREDNDLTAVLIYEVLRGFFLVPLSADLARGQVNKLALARLQPLDIVVACLSAAPEASRTELFRQSVHPRRKIRRRQRQICRVRTSRFQAAPALFLSGLGWASVPPKGDLNRIV
jgi:hypothetical protein